MATDANTPTNSNAGSDAKSATEKPLFSEREENLLKVAMLSLKSGPPEVDMERFIKLGAFNTAKTASNQWSALKKKLISMASAVEGGEVGPIMPVTPKTSKSVTPKKRGKKVDADADGGDAGADNDETTSMKKVRKTPASAKKSATKVKEEDEEGAGGGDGTASPKKKARKTPVKKGPKVAKQNEVAEEDAEPKEGEEAIKKEAGEEDSEEEGEIKGE